MSFAMRRAHHQSSFTPFTNSGDPLGGRSLTENSNTAAYILIHPTRVCASHTRRFRSRNRFLRNTSLFQQVTTETRHRQATYEQFCLDVPRLHLEIDGEVEGCASDDSECGLSNASVLYTHLLNLFDEESVGLWFAYWCTQTALATAYHEQLVRLNSHSRNKIQALSPSANDSHDIVYHLLDDGRQRIHLHSQFVDAGRECLEHFCEREEEGMYLPPSWTETEHTADVDDHMNHHYHTTSHLEEWTIANVCDEDAVLHIQKPFRVVRQKDTGLCQVPVCKYMLHVWVPGHKVAIGSYKLFWQRVH